MAIQPEFLNIRVSGKTEIPAVQVKAECKTDIPSDTVLKVLDVSAFCDGACSTEQPFKISGTVIFNVVYCQADNKIRKCECAQEFSRELSEDFTGKTVIPKISVLKTSADTSGTRLSVSAVLNVGGVVCFSDDFNCLSGGEELIVDREEKPIFKSSGVKKSTFPVEEEVVLPYEIAEVLSQRAAATVNAVQCGVGAIIIDGEVIASALLLQNSENGDIIKEERVFPFRFELECDEAMPKNVATAEVSVGSIRSDVSVDPETGKSTANVIVAIKAEGEAFAEDSVDIIKDAFSVKEEVELEFSQAEFTIPSGIKSVKKNVTGKCPVGIPAGTRAVACFGETAEITSLKTENGIIVTGVYSVKVYYKDATDNTGAVNMETPFEFKIDGFDCDGKTSASVVASGAKIRPITENESEISGDVIITVSCLKPQKIKFASSASAVGEKKVCDAAISVYIPLEGEKLFSLSKRLNVSPETLVSTNDELTFPLSGKERIVIYRQK